MGTLLKQQPAEATVAIRHNRRLHVLLDFPDLKAPNMFNHRGILFPNFNGIDDSARLSLLKTNRSPAFKGRLSAKHGHSKFP